MTSQHQHTIVMISDETVGRVDLTLDGPTDAALSAHWARTDELSLGDAIAVALRSGPQPASQIWVLTDELWSGQVALDKVIVNAIPADQIEQTLALEAEQDSGISPFESRLAYVSISPSETISAVDGRTTWWVTQAEHSQLQEVETAVAGSAGVLAGLASLTISPNQSGDSPNIQDNAPESYEAFARSWLTQVLSTPGKIPVIGSPRDVTPSPWYLRNALVCIAVILMACLTLHLEGNRRITRAATQLSQMTDQEKQLRREFDSAEAAARRFNEVNQKNQAMHEAEFRRRAELRRQRARWISIRRRPTQLLNALAATADPDHWIQEIKLNDQHAQLLGLAVDSKAIAKLCQDLESEMDPSSWLVQPAEMSIVPTTNLVRFELTLFPVEATGDQAVAMLAKRGVDAP